MSAIKSVVRKKIAPQVMIPSRKVTGRVSRLIWRTVKLASLWDNIIEMCEKYDLPSEFQTHNKWIDVGITGWILHIII